jgi:hypothetical protein
VGARVKEGVVLGADWTLRFVFAAVLVGIVVVLVALPQIRRRWK